MDSSLPALVAFFADRSARAEPLVLATVVATAGSTYRKPGSRMLVSPTGAFAGLLSGGCLETDLLEHSRTVLVERSARLVDYDQRSSTDLIWGLGMGCEGAMQVLLQPLAAAEGYRPFDSFARVLRERRPLSFATVVRSRLTEWPVGRTILAHDTASDEVAAILARHCAATDATGAGNHLVELTEAPLTVFVGRIAPPPRLLILGGGPDAVHVVEQAAVLGWGVTLVDHRPTHAVAERFPRAERIVQARPQELDAHLEASAFDAAVVMSHHLESDAGYLRWLARSTLAYVGLLGPAARRERLRLELGTDALRLHGRLFGPVGLDIGATTPEAIALAILAEIHAVLSGRPGGSFSAVAPFGSRD